MSSRKCSHAAICWLGSAIQSSFSIFDSKIVPAASHFPTVASISLLYRYLYGKYSNELHSIVPPTLTHPAKTRHPAYIHPKSFSILLIRSMFHPDSFFPRATLWNRIQGACFLRHCNVNLLMSRVRNYISHMSA